MQPSDYSDVFISYRRKNVEFVKQLVDAMRDKGREVWVDWEDIPPGSEGFTDDIKRGLEGADAFLCVLSPDYLESKYCVELELGYALQLRKKVIPVVLEKFDSKEGIEGISHINWIYFTPHAGQENKFEESFPRILQALDQDLEHARMHKRLGMRAIEWNQRKRQNSYLLKGAEIQEAEEWLAAALNKVPHATDLQTDYIHSSRQLASRRSSQLLMGVSLALVVSLVLAVFAGVQWLEAGTQRNEAQANLIEARTIQSRFLASESVARIDAGQPREAYWMARGSFAYYDQGIASPEGAAALSRVLSFPFTQTAHHKHKDIINGVLWSANKDTLISYSYDGTAHMWKPSGEHVLTLPHNSSVNLVRWDSDESHILTVDEDNTYLWDIDGNEIARWPNTLGVELSPAKNRLLVYNDEQLFLLDMATNVLLELSNVQSVWNKAGDRLLVLNEVGNAIVYDVDGNELFTITLDDSIERTWWMSDDEHLLIHNINEVLVADKDGNIITQARVDEPINYVKDAQTTAAFYVETDTGIMLWDDTGNENDLRDLGYTGYSRWYSPSLHQFIEMTDDEIRLRKNTGEIINSLTNFDYWDVQWSADESRVFINSSSRMILLDTANGQPLLEWEYVSQSGQYTFYFGGNLWLVDGDLVIVFDLETTVAYHIITAVGFVNTFLTDEAKNVLVLVTNDEFMFLEGDGSVLVRIPVPKAEDGRSLAEEIIYSAQGPSNFFGLNSNKTLVAVLLNDGVVNVYRRNGSVLATLAHETPINTLAWEDDWLYTSSEGGDARIWQAWRSPLSALNLDNFAYPIWNKSGTHFITNDNNGLRVWTELGQLAAQLTPNQVSVTLWLDDNTIIEMGGTSFDSTGYTTEGYEDESGTGNTNNPINVWDINGNRLNSAERSGDFHTLLVMNNPAGAQAVFTDEDGFMVLDNQGNIINDFELPATVYPGTDRMLTLSYDNNDAQVVVLRDSKGEPIKTIMTNGTVNNILWSPNGDVFMMVLSTGIDLWTKDGDFVGTLLVLDRGDSGESRFYYGTYDFITDDYVLASDVENILYMWNHQGELIAELEHPRRVVEVHISDDDSRIVTEMPYGKLTVWSGSGEKLTEVEHEADWNGVRFNKDKSRFLTWSWDNTARLWSADGTLLLTLPHNNTVWDARWNDDESRIMTYADIEVKFWDTEGNLLARLPHETDVQGIRWTNDESQIISWDESGSVIYWETDISELLALVEQMPNIPPTDTERAEWFLPDFE